MRSEQDIEDFVKLAVQLQRMLQEFAELSKKKPSDAVNTFKLGLVNNLLDIANGIIDVADRPFEDFERFEQDNVPTNSDVVVILSQYRVCMERFFDDNTADNENRRPMWIIDGKLSEIRAHSSYGLLL